MCDSTLKVGNKLLLHKLITTHKFTKIFFGAVCFTHGSDPQTIKYTVKPSFGILELRNQVTQNNVTLQVSNSKIFTEILLSSY